MELAPGVVIMKDQTIPTYRREGTTVEVDTWGGTGQRMDENGQIFGQTNITGTATFTYATEEMAEEVERMVAEWAENNTLVSVEHAPGTVMLINQQTGYILTNRLGLTGE